MPEAKAQEKIEGQEVCSDRPEGKSMNAMITIFNDRGPRLREVLVNLTALASLFLLGFGALLALAVPAKAAKPFSIEHFSSAMTDQAGRPVVQAGSHPFAMETVIGLGYHRGSIYPEAPLPPEEPTGKDVPNGNVKNIEVVLPKGVVANPNATAIKCLEKELEAEGCPDGSAIGVLNTVLEAVGNDLKAPVYNMLPPAGVPAEFGFNVAGLTVGHIYGGVRTGDGYNLTADVSNISQKLGLMHSQLILWGDPSASVHDPQRGACDDRSENAIETEELELEKHEKFDTTTLCRVERVGPPLLTMPTSCTAEPLETTMTVETWQEPGVLHPAEATAPAASGCALPAFEPSVTAHPDTTSADSSSGFDFDLRVPQPQSFEGIAEANLDDASVTLPPGLVINPSSASGLAACTPAEIGLETANPPSCPAASRIGEVEVDTPLLEHPLGGSVYLATENDNPFHALLAGYIVAEGSGVLIKLPGRFETNPVTGQITASFEENPQLPFEDFKLNFFGGQRAPLTTPVTCGAKEVGTDLTPWTAPEGLDAHPSSIFEVTSGAGGSSCVASEAQEPNAPSFEAGTIAPVAGSYSPFVLRLNREDGSQRLSAIDVALPPGLTGRLAGIQKCSDAQLAVAAGRQNPGEGVLEQASPSCPAASEVGSVTVGAGSGAPVYVGGHAYLAGPYKGAPFSLAVVTPAVAGPFDLGAVVVRSGLYINSETAQVTVKSDPIPTILAGIPLDIRSIAITINRPEFMLNPTSCDAMTVGGEAVSTLNQTASLSNHFQAGGCGGLKFAPRLSATTAGKASKAGGASLDVKVAYPPGPQGTYANIRSVKVDLPVQLPSRLSTLQRACVAATFAANPGNCPPESAIGMATAITPLLNVGLAGPAYLVSHAGEAFPSLEIVLQGEGVKLILTGNTQIKKGITSSTFKTVPDAPVSSFELKLPTGKFSILSANVPQSAHYSLCGQTLNMPTAITGQNGAVIKQTTSIGVSGCAKKKALTRSQKFTAALKACHKKAKGKQAGCEKVARKQYGPVGKKKKK
jgi:hypothetical protein